MFLNYMLAGAATYYVGAFVYRQTAYQNAVGKLPPFVQSIAPAMVAGLVLFGIHESGALKALEKAV